MKKSNFKKNHEDFEAWIIWYRDFLHRIVDARRLITTRHEKVELVEAFVLKCAAVWEILVEEDIITSLNLDSSAYATALDLRLRRNLSRDECRAILIGHRYLDFKSVGHIKGFAKKYLVPSQNPFAAIPPTLGQKIDEFIIMRNVLAHYSGYSHRSYKNFMRKKYAYIRVPEPGDFLITINAKTREYRWSEYFSAFLQCSQKMKASV